MPTTSKAMIKKLKKHGFENRFRTGNIKTGRNKGGEITMHHYFYPAIFHNDEKGGYWISFPDFPECMTQGETMEEAYEMAVEAMGLCIDDRLKNEESLPEVSAPVDYILQEGDFSCLIEFDLVQYRKKHNTKSVKKTLSIPEWLNEAAMEHDINFSQVLQEALMKKIGI